VFEDEIGVIITPPKAHTGVVGLVATRLKGKSFRGPAFCNLPAFEPGGIGTGSGRSIAVRSRKAARQAVG